MSGEDSSAAKKKSEEEYYGTVMGRPFYKRNGQAGLQF